MQRRGRPYPLKSKVALPGDAVAGKIPAPSDLVLVSKHLAYARTAGESQAKRGLGCRHKEASEPSILPQLFFRPRANSCSVRMDEESGLLNWREKTGGPADAALTAVECATITTGRSVYLLAAIA